MSNFRHRLHLDKVSDKESQINPLLNSKMSELQPRAGDCAPYFTQMWLRGNPAQDAFLGVEAVFRLVEDGGGMGFERGFVDLFSAVSWQAVHDEGVGLREGDECLVDLIGLEALEALLGLRLLSHRDPDVGIKEVRAARGCFE